MAEVIVDEYGLELIRGTRADFSQSGDRRKLDA